MNIDTLIFSGGGVKCLSFLGGLSYLMEHNYVDKNLKNIKKIICVSGSLIFIIPLLVGYSIKETNNFFCKYDFENIISDEKKLLNNLIMEYGMYNNDHFCHVTEIFLEKKNLQITLTLKQLYELNNIELSIKVINLTKGKEEYLSHITHPDIPLTTALQMTTCIPLLFRPIIYKNEYYIDGGTLHNFPIDINTSDNFLAMNVSNKDKKINDILTIYDYIKSIIKLSIVNNTDTIDHRIIYIETNVTMTDFNLSYEQKKNIIQIGYDTLNKHFNTHIHIDS
tara:strand:+ start:176 stop:1015 length:840 start_codon:yes stop_codon:yes gene_type:complete